MCINVARRVDVAVTEPLLNLLQAHAIGIEQTGAAMAQIVKADTLHLVCDQKIREMLAQEIGPNPLSHRVYIDIVKIIGAIAFAADLPVLLLLLFHFIEHLLTGRDQGKCPAARLCFCLISCDFRYRSVDLCGHNRMLIAFALRFLLEPFRVGLPLSCHASSQPLPAALLTVDYC